MPLQKETIFYVYIRNVAMGPFRSPGRTKVQSQGKEGRERKPTPGGTLPEPASADPLVTGLPAILL